VRTTRFWNKIGKPNIF